MNQSRMSIFKGNKWDSGTTMAPNIKVNEKHQQKSFLLKHNYRRMFFKFLTKRSVDGMDWIFVENLFQAWGAALLLTTKVQVMSSVRYDGACPYRQRWTNIEYTACNVHAAGRAANDGRVTMVWHWQLCDELGINCTVASRRRSPAGRPANMTLQ